MNLFRTVAALAAVTVMAAGCTGDPEATPPSPTAPTVSESRSVTPRTTGASETSLTDAPDGETARQFLRRFVALDEQMQLSGKTKAYLSVTGPDCTSCVAHARWVTKVHKAGGSISLRSSSVLRVKHVGGNQWSLIVRTHPSSYIESSGAQPVTLSGGRVEFTVYMAKVSGSWIIASYTQKG